MRARYYDPRVGRFISEDPLGFDGGDVNLYAYVGNNPIMGVDPSGLCAVDFNFTSGFVGTNAPIWKQNSGWSGSPTFSASTDFFAASLQVSLNNPLNPPTRDTSNDVFVNITVPFTAKMVNLATNTDFTRVGVSVGPPSLGIPLGSLNTSIERPIRALSNGIANIFNN